MKKPIVILLLVILLAMQSFGQERKNVLGARIGLSSGITYEHFVDPFRAYRGMISFRDGGVQLMAMLQSSRPLYLNFTDKIYYYTGIGAHIGFTRFQPQRSILANPFRFNYMYGRFAPVIGLDAMIGLEYRLERAPLIFALDAKPFFELFGQNIFRLSLFDIGLSIKFTF
ncbi:MAG TPA: hypothetical protein VK994_01840 [Bacteroidales bacterium]|nr:hypothetical protein [Bacteroidales bacterium]